DVIAPAAAGAILGGISLGGGTGRPLGIAAGALTLAVLRSGLNAVGAPPFVNDIVMGAVLLTVAVLDGPDLARRLIVVGRLARRSPAAPGTGALIATTLRGALFRSRTGSQRTSRAAPMHRSRLLGEHYSRAIAPSWRAS